MVTEQETAPRYKQKNQIFKVHTHCWLTLFNSLECYKQPLGMTAQHRQLSTFKKSWISWSQDQHSYQAEVAYNTYV